MNQKYLEFGIIKNNKKKRLRFLNKPLYFLFTEDKKKWSTIDLKSNNFLKAFLKQIQFYFINVKKFKI